MTSEVGEVNRVVSRGKIEHILKTVQCEVYLINGYLEKSGKGTRQRQDSCQRGNNRVRTLENPPRERAWTPQMA